MPAVRAARVDGAPLWEHYEHGADIGVRGYGWSKAEAFEHAALALTAVVTDPALVGEFDVVELECEAPDDDLLLAEWLNALIYQMATRRLLFSRFVVRIDGTRLKAKAWGEPVNPERHHPAVEPKGATYTTLRVARHGEGWIAQTVVDV
ncbi:MAG TPA: archease [Burkholderiales bacterium]|nr:archease [Burkholderiales bacterium]